MRQVVYPLSADPIHNGHLFVLDALLQLSDVEHIYVGLGTNENKVGSYTFTVEERLLLAQRVLARYHATHPGRVILEKFDGLLADYAKQKNCQVVYRGIRDAADTARERTMAAFNAKRGIETRYIQASPAVAQIRSSALKQAVQEGKFVYDMAPVVIQQALQEKLRNTFMVGVTGNIGSGKTTLCRRLADKGAHHIDADALIHTLYRSNATVRKYIADTFGSHVIQSGEVDRQQLGRIVFTDAHARQQLADVLRQPFTKQIEREISQLSGLVLLDCAYLVEYDLLSLVNNNVILMHCSTKEKIRRHPKARHILPVQFTESALEEAIVTAQAQAGHGQLMMLNSEQDINDEQILEHLFLERLLHWKILPEE